MVDESAPAASQSKSEVAPGIHAAYDMPAEDIEGDQDYQPVDTSISLEELMAQMKSI